MTLRLRRSFLKSSSAALVGAATGLSPVSFGAEDQDGEQLYNGIRLPKQWPPRFETLTREPPDVPYLRTSPEVIPIDIGRQLLVDDFLIENTNLIRKFHSAEIHPASPVLRPEAGNGWEHGNELPTAMTFSDTVWYDAQKRLYKMWYMAGFTPAVTCYAESEDGIKWRKPSLSIRPGTNVVHELNRDSSTLWPDLLDPDPNKRFKLSLVPADAGRPWHMNLYHSPDGIHWSDVVAKSGPCGDRSTFFYNPFRKVWVYSLRGDIKGIRCRRYWENTDLFRGAAWTEGQPTYWVGADKLDPPDPAEPDAQSQLYTLDAVGYESILLGVFSMMRGKKRKGNNLVLGYSRDGFYWDRPERSPFVSTSPQVGDWNHDYLHPVGGCCLIVGDRLHFYVGARSGDLSQPTASRSVGLVTLRRDGFASLEAGEGGGTLTTRPISFRGKHLFVNAAAQAGQLRAEVLDQHGKVVRPFTTASCIPVTADRTLSQIHWKGAKDLSRLSGQPLRFRFSLQNGSLYAFWVSSDQAGSSNGYVGAGGPGFTVPIDTARR